ncbi:MAG: pitrilysin family protein, partial [bacterium]
METLPNGLKVLVRPNSASSVVTLDMWVNTGSTREKPALNGVSHFLEHMLFKGTEKYGVNEIDRMIEGVGGLWNAGTSRDFTHYYLTLASRYFDLGLEAISEVIQHSSLDAGELDKERLVILEEYRRKQDSPGGLLWEKVYDVAYRRSPYRASILGTEDTIRGISREGMNDYYCRHYAPGNMLFVVAGDVGESEVLGKIRESFADFSRPFRPYDGLDDGEERSEGQEQMIPKDVQETYGAWVFAAPGIVDIEDVLACDIAAVAVGQGRSSRLYRSIKEEKQLVSTIGCAYPSHRKSGLLVILSTFDYAQKESVETALREELEKFAEQGPTDKELAKAKRMLINSHYFAKETTSGQSGLLGYFYTLTGSLEFEER